MTGILTFHWADDFGAMLQAYALKEKLRLMGEPAELLPYAPRHFTGRYRWLPVVGELREGRVHCRRCYGRWLQNLRQGGDFLQKRRAMAGFRRRYLTDRRAVSRPEELSLAPYRCLIVGSDQVWNPDITVALDDAYLGRLPGREGCRIISYAASLGGSDLPEPFRRDLARALCQNFAAVSVRERSAVPFLESLLRRPVASVLDPTLLLERPRWEQAARPPLEKGYLLVYAVEQNEAMARAVRACARELALPAVQIAGTPWWSAGAGTRPLPGMGPAEFLGCFQNAGWVITNSFHGTAFSLLYEKPFLTYCHTTRGARMRDLLAAVGLEGRLAPEGAEEESPARLRAPVDWPAAARRLAAERRLSEEFLAEQLRLAKDVTADG